MKKEKSKVKVVILNKGVNARQSTLWGYRNAEAREEKQAVRYRIVKDMPFKVKIFD